MKNNIINIARSKSLLFASLLAVSFANISCLDNRDPNRLIDEDMEKDYKWAAFIKSMQVSVVPLGQNQYQLTDDLHGNNYAGYIGEMQDWNSNSNSLTYFFSNSLKWHDEMFNVTFGKAGDETVAPGNLPSWNMIRKKTGESSLVFQFAQIMKVMQMHRATDSYGPLPYFGYGLEANPKYDSQQEIYYSFFEDLNVAITKITDAYFQNPKSTPIIGNDYMFNSNLEQWIKFANSLKLRLAMRISLVDPIKARQYAEEAVKHPIGVITMNSDNATLKQDFGIAQYRHPLNRITNIFNEPAMGSNMDSYMNGYKDPRLSMYFTPSQSARTYHGMPSGISNPKSYSGKPSVPNIGYSAELVFISAAEVAFLRAEGAINNWDMGGSAESFYKQGIELSMQYHDIQSTAINEYINDESSKPAAFTDLISNNTIAAVSTVGIKWNDSDNKELKIEKVITQKWIALYPNGTEAWAEQRRTGYPKLYSIKRNSSGSGSVGGVVSSDSRIRRLPLPSSEYTNNGAIVRDAVAKHLNGTDAAATKLWWDVK